MEEDKIVDVNETEKYLPIGTVVLLKGATKRLMIAGYCAVDQEKKDEMWDYSGCMYPEGFLSSQQSFLFDHSQIAKIYSLGYKDNEEEEFQQKLVNYINSKGSGEDGDSADSSEGEGSAPVSGETDSSTEVVETEDVVSESDQGEEIVEENASVAPAAVETVVETPIETPVASAEVSEPTTATVEPTVPPIEPATVPVESSTETGTTAPVEQAPVTNVAPEAPVASSEASTDAANPNNAGDLSEFDQWLNQTGPYSNNNTNGQQ